MPSWIKKILAVMLLVLVSAFLNGCGGSDETPAASGTGGLKAYDAGEFSLQVDPSWKVLNQSDFYADIPQNTVIAFTAPEAVDGFFANVSVLKEDLKENISAADYARANINLSGQNLTDYQKIQEAAVDNSGQKTLIHIFQARLNPSEKLIRFVQLYNTKGHYGYIVTGGMLPDTPKETRDRIGAMVTSFGLK